MAKKPTLTDSLTTEVVKEEKVDNTIRVPVFIQEIQGSGGDMKVDQYEHVTLANENGETCYKILRGETVDVPLPVFIALKERYPKL